MTCRDMTAHFLFWQASWPLLMWGYSTFLSNYLDLGLLIELMLISIGLHSLCHQVNVYMCSLLFLHKKHTHTHRHLCASEQWGYPYRFEKRQHIWSIKWVLWDCGSNIDSSKVNITSNWRGQRWWSVTELFGYLMALWKASLSARKIINWATWRIRQVHIKPVISDIDTE